MTLTTDALARLYAQAKADYERPWKPGMQLTDAELIAAYIDRLKTDLDLALDERYIRNEGWR